MVLPILLASITCLSPLRPPLRGGIMHLVNANVVIRDTSRSQLWGRVL